MVSADEIRTGMGIAGNIISLALFLSPMPTFVRICKKRSVEEFSAIPYAASLANCLLWLLYGLPAVHPKSTLILTVNGAGATIQLCYIVVYIIYSGGPTRLKALVFLVADLVLFAVVSAIVLNVFHTQQRRSLVAGILCVVFCTAMYLAPLSVMKMVIKKKSVEYMPLLLSVTSFLNGLSWTTYALIRFDVYITIPNVLGVLFSATQLIMHMIYYKSTKRQIAEMKTGKPEFADVEIQP